ncbi:MAG: hypothetical protein A2Y64_00180 [Candidatus Coatesbacteria bacterium RBG_13_66_14]|uniref:Uncharacterized protein n=1 Tax=Candidatus Coatesbacteria bacterium RBG_13_66_14 TaxID=1817816 RepID=A0A1F5FIM3_9BACT|nr:MAG: hypothetical protein A2Y64_00180 [Candidatus Coatesbacteria bacterium RBG_13_66_14]
MSKITLLTVTAILFALPAVRAADEWAGADLVLKVDTEYAFSHGWGHVLRCQVRDVLKGEFEAEEIALNVWASFDDFYPFARHRGIILGFVFYGEENPYGGFKDSAGNWWQLVSIGLGEEEPLVGGGE